MKHKKYVLIIIFIVACILILRNIGKDEKIQYTTITLEKEPEFICPSNEGELLMVVDGKIISYDVRGKAKIIPTDVKVSEVYPCGDWMWIIDTERNLYKLEEEYNDIYVISDVILKDIVYVEGSPIDTFAINSKGEVFAWGDNENGTLGLGEISYVEEPTKIDYIEDAVAVKGFHINSVIFDSEGNVYVAGYVYSDKGEEFLRTFEKIDTSAEIKCIADGPDLFVLYEYGHITTFNRVERDDYGKLFIETSMYYEEENFADYHFEQINGSGNIALALDTEGNLYYWGEDFIKKRESKADYEIHGTPQLINFPKEVEDVYATYDAAFLKNGLEIYILTRQK